MKALFLLLLPVLLLSDIKELVQSYKKQQYKKVCQKGYRLFKKLQKDEALISMYAFSCLKSDYIDRLAVPILALGKTAQGRRNRSYFSLILAQKNLLISALADKEEYQNLHIPQTDHLISKIFNIYFQKKYKKVDNIYEATQDGIKYRFFIKRGRSGYPYLIIIVQNQNKKEKHIYR